MYLDDAARDIAKPLTRDGRVIARLLGAMLAGAIRDNAFGDRRAEHWWLRSPRWRRWWWRLRRSPPIPSRAATTRARPPRGNRSASWSRRAASGSSMRTCPWSRLALRRPQRPQHCRLLTQAQRGPGPRPFVDPGRRQVFLQAVFPKHHYPAKQHHHAYTASGMLTIRGRFVTASRATGTMKGSARYYPPIGKPARAALTSPRRADRVPLMAG